MFAKGQVVFSKCGRDKGRAFVVVDAAEEYVFLVDGRLRLLARPKKKKTKHVQPTHTVLEETYLLDAHVRKALAPYNQNSCVK